jgi:hypothetical protein
MPTISLILLQMCYSGSISSLNRWLGREGSSRTVSFTLLASLCCSIAFSQAPPNDNFTNATVLYGSSAIFSGTLSNATVEPGESLDECYPAFHYTVGSLWWSWTATNSTAVVIDILATAGTSPAVLVIETGSALSSLND